jgi:anthranilate synthase component 1
MLSFDLEKEAFVKLASGIKNPCLIQLLAKVDQESFTCSPLELYRTLRAAGNSRYSYLLESVEKQETKARYSFVGNDPDCIIKISNRKMSLDLLNLQASDFFEEIVLKIKEVCGLDAQKKENCGKKEEQNREIREVNTIGEIKEINPEKENPDAGEELKQVEKLEKFEITIPQGKDAFDALRLAFPPANGIELKNGSSFERQTFSGGAIGYTAYDAIYDSWLKVEKGFESEIPELQYLLVSKTFVFDHMTGTIYIVITPFVKPGSNPESIYKEALAEAEVLYSLLKKAVKSETLQESNLTSPDKSKALGKHTFLEKPDIIDFSAASPVSTHIACNSACNLDRQGFEASVLQAKEHIFAGDIFQAVLSRKCEFELEKTPFELYTQLRTINPSPYMYIFEFGELAIIGASPETLLTVHKRTLIINPIAGTCPRGKTEAEDRALASHMLQDEKERAEHVMLVDLGRNDVRMVAESGSVKVSDFMKVLKYSHVQHIESTVSGKLRQECDQFDAFRAIFPAGTLSGAPKIRAMEIISRLEASPRGIYGGGVGYYSWNGDADFAIVIRTVLMQGKKASVQAGAGIVADSDPEYEFKETERKMEAMLTAICAGF